MDTQRKCGLRVLIDSKGLQARVHRRNERLCTLLSYLRQWHTIEFSSPGELTESELEQCDVLIITTRSGRKFAYASEEYESIENFVRDNSGLLLMSNHGGPSEQRDTRKYDSKLVRKLKLGVAIENTFFENYLADVPTVLAGTVLNSEHPIITGSSDGKRVNSIVTKTCCSVKPEEDKGVPIVHLSDDMVDRMNQKRPSSEQLFAHALEASSVPGLEGGGRIVTVADSGFIGSIWTQNPGPGLARWGDNLRFVDNAIRWLGHNLDW